MTDLPKSVRVAGVEHKVEMKELVVEDNVACYGVYDTDTSSITLTDTGNISLIETTLIHELLHAIAYQYDLRFLDDEENVSRLSKALYQVLNDNFLVETIKH